MSDPLSFVYFGGRVIPAGEAHLPVDDRGVLYGLGFFETFRTSGGRPHLWPYHLRRLTESCAVAGFALPASSLATDPARLQSAIDALLDCWTTTSRPLHDAVFRYTLTAGPVGGAPAEFLTTRPLPPEPPSDGIALHVLDLLRDSGEWLPRPKSLAYANALLGAEELARRATSPHDEGLFLSRAGRFVVETPRQNLAWFVGGRLCYPDPALGAVAGTTLAWVLATGGLTVEPCCALLDELLDADAVIVMNAVRGITPVKEIWGAAARGPLWAFASAAHLGVAALQACWAEALRTTATA